MAGRKGRSGGRKKPPGFLLVTGQFREDRHGSKSAAEAAVRSAKAEGCPSPPGFLTKTAVQEWRRVSRDLHGRGLLRKVDRSALMGYCQAYGELREAQDGITHELAAAQQTVASSDEAITPGARAVAARIVMYGALVVPGKNGWVRNPAVTIINQAAKRIREFCIEFGMTPSSQHRLQFARGEDQGAGVEGFRGSHPKAQQG